MNKEQKKIDHAIGIFSEWMGKRMFHKEEKGFMGWEYPSGWKVRERLLIKAAKIASVKEMDDKDIVDIANFAMMLFMERWYEGFPYNEKQPEAK